MIEADSKALWAPWSSSRLLCPGQGIRQRHKGSSKQSKDAKKELASEGGSVLGHRKEHVLKDKSHLGL